MTTIDDYKKYLKIEIDRLTKQIDTYKSAIEYRINQNHEDEIKISNLTIALGVFQKNEIEFDKISENRITPIPAPKTSTPTTKFEIDDILIDPFEFDANDIIQYKNIKIHMSGDFKQIAVKYATGTYYTNIEKVLQIPYPVKVSQAFGLTWHNNNKTAIKMVRDYLATTDHDPDKPFYATKINNTQVNREEEKINYE